MRMNMLESQADNILIDKDKCTYCGICVERCVLDNLRMKLAPCRQACPLGVNCHGYVQTISRKEEDKAIALLRETLPFPGILGRICSQPCEEKCHRKNIEGEAVAIRSLKRYLSDLEDKTEIALPEMKSETGKKVAVIGSGPAGMMGAYDLRLEGHAVTVFEAESEPGGMLRWAIPEFRLPKEILDREIDLLVRIGVKFCYGVVIGRDKSLSDIKAEFDAVLIATGCPEHAKLSLEGDDTSGIYYGLPFLMSVRRGQAPRIGKTVVVIGGGNVAVDAAQTSLRLGAKSVTIFALESESELPAFPWAVQSAMMEGVKLECAWGNPALQIVNGELKGMDFQKCLQVFDAGGCFQPRFDDCQLKSIEADTIIIAVGQQIDPIPFKNTGLLENGRFQADAITLQSADEKVFLAGDLLGGPSSVVQAMAYGRQAAESIHRYLIGDHLRYGRTYPGAIETDFEIDTSCATKDRRLQAPVKKFKGQNDFSEIEQGIDETTARKEAARCYSCGQPFGKYRTCWFCLPCEVDCPHEALWVQIPYLMR